MFQTKGLGDWFAEIEVATSKKEVREIQWHLSSWNRMNQGALHAESEEGYEYMLEQIASAVQKDIREGRGESFELKMEAYTLEDIERIRREGGRRILYYPPRPTIMFPDPAVDSLLISRVSTS